MFQRSPLIKNNSQFSYNKGDKNVSKEFHKAMEENGYSKSYVHAVKIGPHSINKKEDLPAIVLDETCFNQTVYSTALMGKVKDFTSLTNLKVALANERFDNIKLKYMGGFWVMIEFNTKVAKERFRSNVGIASWFAQLLQASNSFFFDERVTWVDIEGIPLKGWSKNTFSCITTKWGELLYYDEQEEGYLHSKRVCIKTKLVENIYESFKIIIQGKIFWVRAKEVSGWIPDFEEDDDDDDSKSDDEMRKDDNHNGNLNSDDNLKYPPGFTPATVVDVQDNTLDELDVEGDNYVHNIQDNKVKSAEKKNSPFNSLKNDTDRSVCSGHFKKCEIPSSGDLAQKAKKDWVRELCSKNKYSPSVGNSGGILCIWDPSMFRKINSTISDYFVMIQGEWVPNGKKIIIISVYAPQELCEKKMLWDYLILVLNNWNGEVVIMGDFNEVRMQEERHGSIFSVHGANAFNWFISTAGLEEVPLDGCKFTWCHKSASNMSKLDRFFISKSFDHFVEQTWNDAQVTDMNAMSKLMKKLKYLKEKIRMWIKDNKDSSKNYKQGLKDDLVKIDLLLDNGEGNSDILTNRINQLAIRGILAEGRWIESPVLVKSEFFSHFASRFDKPPLYRLHIDKDFPKKLSFDQQTDLENTITRDEIKKAVWDCRVVLYFFQYGKFPKGSNSSFIALIPKTHDAKMVKDFRPITLIGSLYKIIANILANLIVVVLGDIVNDVQSTFVANRQILDGPFILNELFQWCMKKKNQTMIFKVDFEKAYDSVRWDYLDDILKKFGFGDKWCGWIRNCLISSKGSVIMNDNPTKEFQFHRGLKQGDPLSPFLFILIMESLHISVQSVVDADMFRGSKVGCLMSRTQSWNEVVNNILARLSKWKMKTLSIGGRLTLLKSILEHNGKKQIWVKWSKVLASKENGGLGVSSLYALNRVLCLNGCGVFALNNRLYGPREVHQLKNQDIDLMGFILKKMANGEDTLFWEDAWRGDNNFKLLYPRMYALETQKNVTVASKMSHVDMSSSFRRAPRGGSEESQFTQLLRNMEGVSLVDMKDRWIWSLEGCGEFSVPSVRKVLDDRS
ncbi:RNA-directed DNA polymerase, eukaryota, reverse transcriptase zinc-binding domain protein [Tanacetum coccineum]